MCRFSTIPCAGESRAHRDRRALSGFALLITIVLVAFLVLVLVGLATFTRVETQVAANGQQLAQARSNALYALNLALGQLQRHAGPDQRVTARADIDAANAANPFWTGVWDATPPDPAVPSHAAAPASSDPLVWLVNGNESDGDAVAPATAVPEPDGSNDVVWMLRRSNGVDLAADPDDPTPAGDDRRVRLRASPITVPAAQVPGFSSTAPDPRIGSYAWWVGDEGVKAKINLDDPYAGTSDAREAAWRREAPARAGLELLDAAALAEVFTDPAPQFEAARRGLISSEQLPMLDAGLATGDGREQSGRRFHDLTVFGSGVLADTLRGGLRRDLTRGLAATPASGSVAATEIGDSTAVFALPPPGPYGRTVKLPLSSMWTPSREPHAPTWQQVRAWTGHRASSAGAIDPQDGPLADLTGGGITCPAPTGHALMPVTVMLELGYGLDVGPDGKFRVMMRPRVVLMNPYNVTLNPASYSLIYQPFVTNKSDVNFGFNHSVTVANKASAEFLLGDLISLHGAKRMAFNLADGFAPGEIKAYSLPASATTDILIDGSASIIELEPGIGTNRAYFATSADAPSWYLPAERHLINVSQSTLPADQPRLSLALGKATPGHMPAVSMTSRYLQTEASVISDKPHPSRRLDTDGDPATIDDLANTGRQLRTIRFTLRPADTGLLTHGSSNMASEGEIGGALASDTTSGARFLVDNNPRAIVSQRIGGRSSVAHYAVSSLKGSAYTEIDHEDLGASALAYWGGSTDASAGTTHAMLFDVLRAGEEIVSLGRLAHVNWGVDGKHPAYPLGNSFASVFYPAASPDYGYALNEALWDRFFLSTLPTADLDARPAHLPNSRLAYHDPAGASADLSALEDMDGYQLAATRLLLNGAFNINSTSVEAWAAFLGGVQAADYAYKTRTGAGSDSGVRPFPRLRNLHEKDPTDAPNDMHEWTGYRHLDADQLKALASEIVAGIRARGRPARSLAEFMNRDLSKPSTDTLNQMGVVQAAIDAVINTATPASGGSGTGLADLPGLNTAEIVATTFVNADNPDAARGKLRSAGAPGFLLQSDLLTPLAPAMSARSDTFRVRAYGEARNPVTGDIVGRAWCEAVVQRLPELVGGEPAESRLADLAPGSDSAKFGRKFIVTQFRWLGADEI